MTLNNIFDEILEIRDGLRYQSISFCYGKIACAMGCGHPACILAQTCDDVYSMVLLNQEPPVEKLEELLVNLKEFQEGFCVKEMEKPVNHLEAYIKEK